MLSFQHVNKIISFKTYIVKGKSSFAGNLKISFDFLEIKHSRIKKIESFLYIVFDTDVIMKMVSFR